MIRHARPDDTERICAIYNHYVLNTVVTFEETAVSLADMGQRVEDAQREYCWLVYELDGVVAAYAYATKWKVRAAYRFAVEVSVYVDHTLRGKGLGKALYADLLQRLRGFGVHSVVGGVAGENAASVALHAAFGFREVARFREIGRKFDQWIDVTYYQLMLT